MSQSTARHAAAITGSQGADRIVAGRGGDTIDGGAGDDLLFAGIGADVFRMNAASGRDTIRLFDATADRIDLTSLATGFDQLEFAATAGGRGTDITAFDAGGTAHYIILFDVLPALLTEANFSF